MLSSVLRTPNIVSRVSWKVRWTDSVDFVLKNVCANNLQTDSSEIVSPINGRVYPVNSSLKCGNCGIYAISCRCLSLYTGKTTGQYNCRFHEHFSASSGSAVFDHTKRCQLGKSMKDFNIQFLENMYSRGKYSLSEREYLWNERLRGIMNIQKTLKG